MAYEQERMQILEMIANGQISASEGVNLLNALEEQSEQLQMPEPPPPPEAASTMWSVDTSLTGEAAEAGEPWAHGMAQVFDMSQDEPPAHWDTPAQPEPLEKETYGRPVPEAPNVQKWKRWWLIPLWAGVFVTAVSGLLMFSIYQASQFSFWFACSWVPFLAGVALLALAWGGRHMHWLHLRVHQEPGKKPGVIAISLPLPLGLVTWLARVFGHWIPAEHTGTVNMALLSLKGVSSENPLYIEVDEGDGKDRVEIFIG